MHPENLRREGRTSSPSRSQGGASGCSTLVNQLGAGAD
jgi:hypothetical protein